MDLEHLNIVDVEDDQFQDYYFDVMKEIKAKNSEEIQIDHNQNIQESGKHDPRPKGRVGFY